MKGSAFRRSRPCSAARRRLPRTSARIAGCWATRPCIAIRMTLSIASAIERLVASQESASLRETLVQRGHQRVKCYHSSRCAGEWVDLFDRLKSGRGLGERRKAFVPAEPGWLPKVA